MSESPLVSAVVPAFNAETTIRATLYSILAQTVEDIEIIVIDDGSTDGTADVVRQIDDGRLRFVQQENQGVSAARNNGVAQARGEWVAFLDSDDLWLPHKLERQLFELERSGMEAAQSSVVFIDAEGTSLGVRHCEPGGDQLMQFLSFQNMPAVMETLIVRRSHLEEVGGFSTDLVILEDWELMIRLARTGGVLDIREPLAMYRQHAANRSRDLSIHVTPGLMVLDKLFADPTLPSRVREQKSLVYARFYTMLSGGALRVGDTGAAVRWALRAVRANPRVMGYILALPARGFRRRRAAVA